MLSMRLSKRFVQQIVLDGFAFVGIRDNLLDCYKCFTPSLDGGFRLLPEFGFCCITRIAISRQAVRTLKVSDFAFSTRSKEAVSGYPKTKLQIVDVTTQTSCLKNLVS